MTANKPKAKSQDQMIVTPNGVYVIPPNRDMAIFHGVLQLSVPEQPRGLRMPIDAFLRSLPMIREKMSLALSCPAPVPTERWVCVPSSAAVASP
ncbi:protein of unknown function [Candidatus Nitrotoga arctica]|uniref:CheB-type methylesterase domain-containing protein n=1 Tax=Candidatus Nitrotoga arctica TaxID=453162 RepID=A0ABM8YXQ2_9PROT|nr:protein of unknown function [Candidatus Nitrotoga arctica]